MTTPDPKRRDIAAEHVANSASLQESLKDYQSNQLKSLAPVAAVLATTAVFAAKRQAEAQNDAMLHQLWVQTELMSGRSMGDINRQLASETQQRDIEATAMFWFWVRSVVVLIIGAVVYGWSSYNGWLGILALILGYVVVRLTVGRYRNLTAPDLLEIEDDPSNPHIGSGTHTAWIEDFRADQTRKLKADPPTG